MVPAIWWGLLAVSLFIAEVATASFFFLWIGAGAAVTALASFFVGPDWAQCLVFLLTSIFLVAVSRPWAARISPKTARLANVDSLVGQEGRIARPLRAPGQAYAVVEGESWRVEEASGKSLKAGDRVKVREVRSNQLIVELQNAG
ncbi:MAG TPA: NfeD family protein [bacterium]|nr:NfeD family protein [bacterium]